VQGAKRAASRQRVCLWLWDDALRIDCRDELLASYPCTYDAASNELRKVQEPTLHPNRFGQQQGALFTLNQEQWQRIRRLNREHRARFSRCRNHPQLPIVMEK
jgi:hypothetical protein